MPVMIIGADTTLGPAIVDALAVRGGEVRAFVSTVEVVDALRAKRVKTALGDISDGTHVGGAALTAFVAVVIAEAASDDRERAFAAASKPAAEDQHGPGQTDQRADDMPSP